MIKSLFLFRSLLLLQRRRPEGLFRNYQCAKSTTFHRRHLHTRKLGTTEDLDGWNSNGTSFRNAFATQTLHAKAILCLFLVKRRVFRMAAPRNLDFQMNVSAFQPRECSIDHGLRKFTVIFALWHRGTRFPDDIPAFSPNTKSLPSDPETGQGQSEAAVESANKSCTRRLKLYDPERQPPRNSIPVFLRGLGISEKNR